MGKIKTKIIKRTGDNLENTGINFTTKFEENKKILGKHMPSKKMRNQIAGYLTRFKRKKLNEKPEALKEKIRK